MAYLFMWKKYVENIGPFQSNHWEYCVYRVFVEANFLSQQIETFNNLNEKPKYCLMSPS